jgi:hypothetical protein
MDTIIMSKEKLLDQIEALKVAWVSEFTDSIKFFEDDVERWLVRYIKKTDDIKGMLHQLSIDLREVENKLFEIKTKHIIMTSQIRECIVEWLRKYFVKITDIDQHEVVTMVMPPPSQKQPPTKYISSIK